MIPKEVSVTLECRPIAWKRPAGKRIRYDAQTDEKAVFSLKVLRKLHEIYPELRTSPKPYFRRAVAVTLHFHFAKHREKTAMDLPDVDNLCKFALDAMQSQYLDGVLWGDDAQVVRLYARKTLGINDVVEISIKDEGV